MEQNKFKRYDSPEQYAEAFQQMIDAREKWREQVREQEAQKDTIFMDDGAYHFFIDNSEHEHGSYDPKILDVVTVILEEFFSQEPTVMLYICDSTDHRQAARDRLYHLWFYDYARSHEMTLYSDSVTFKKVNYYAGILMRHDHPLHDMILSYYQDFLKHVPQLYAPREK